MNDVTDLRSGPLSRRRVLGLGGLTTVGVGLALAGCGTSPASTAQATAGPSGSAAPGSLGELKYAFSWLYDVTQAGPYISDTKGYYTKAGFSSVEFIPGGPSAVPVLTQLISGTAQFGVSGPDEVAAANNNGASIKIIGAMYQKSPACIVSLPGKPLKTPADLKGKTIGVADNDKPSLLAFLAINGLKPADMTLVPFQYDPAPLIDGQMDGFVGYSTQDPISLQESGHQAVIMMYSDFGFRTVYQVYVATADTISSSPDVLKAALRADIMGWRDNIADPEEGASLTVTKYGKSLQYSLQNQLAADKAGMVLMKTPDTQLNGILTVTPALQSQTVKTLALSGAQTTVGDLFDMSLLAEVYQEYHELKRPT
jgi:ABC-type nitrate/sulfonate/bicarbonate transport system substrate-binding protein